MAATTAAAEAAPAAPVAAPPVCGCSLGQTAPNTTMMDRLDMTGGIVRTVHAQKHTRQRVRSQTRLARIGSIVRGAPANLHVASSIDPLESSSNSYESSSRCNGQRTEAAVEVQAPKMAAEEVAAPEVRGADTPGAVAEHDHLHSSAPANSNEAAVRR